MKFSDILLNWYVLNKREFPWRNTQNPYFIWLSEIILQQTKTQQGLPYYLKFIKTKFYALFAIIQSTHGFIDIGSGLTRLSSDKN